MTEKLFVEQKIEDFEIEIDGGMNCLVCNKELNKKQKMFCSQKCHYLSKKGKPSYNKGFLIVPRNARYCKTCGKEFVVVQRSKRVFCSIKCANPPGLGFAERYGLQKAQAIKEKRALSIFVPRESRSCLYCKKEFEVRITNPQKYCSHSCSARNFKHTLESKQKIKIFNIRRWRENPTSFLGARNIILPNISEKQIFERCQGNAVPIEYVGDRKFWLTSNGRHLNPDFLVKDQRKVIELFGDYWHKGRNPQERVNLFKDIGYACLIIWEHELKNMENVLKRIKNFIYPMAKECR